MSEHETRELDEAALERAAVTLADYVPADVPLEDLKDGLREVVLAGHLNDGDPGEPGPPSA